MNQDKTPGEKLDESIKQAKSKYDELVNSPKEKCNDVLDKLKSDYDSSVAQMEKEVSEIKEKTDGLIDDMSKSWNNLLGDMQIKRKK